MNILLICPREEVSTRSNSAPLGVLSVATYLKENGHNVIFIDRGIKKYNVKKVIADFRPDLVGIAMMSTKAIRDSLSMCKIFKKHNIPVVWGGTLTSLMPNLVLSSGLVDFVVIGEGEITMLELVNALTHKKPFREIDGLAYFENGEIVVNNDRAFADLSELPVIDWRMVDPSKYFLTYFGCKNMMYLYASKGCPNQCTFCMNKQYHRSTYRKRPLAYVLQEIKYLVECCGLEGVFFTDELCCATIAEMHSFCDTIKSSGIHFVWGCQTRITGFSQKDFEYMYDAGCRWIFFGIESGSKDMLSKIKKGIAYDKIVSTVTNCHRAGIVATIGFIIGFPDETEEDLRQSIALAKEMPFAMRAFQHFTPVPGSELFHSLRAENRYGLPPTLIELAKSSPWDNVTKNLSEIPPKELNVVRTYFMMSTYLGKKPHETSKPFGFAIKIIKERFHDMVKGGAGSFIIRFASTVKTFLTFAYYYSCFPKIRKKYGLYQK